MRKVIATLLLLVQMVGYSTVVFVEEDTWCEQNQEACVRRHLLQLYLAADVVYEVSVQAVERQWRNGDRRSLNTVKVEHVWKTDGEPLEELVAGWGGDDGTIALKAGARYVVFAPRIRSFWSFLPWVGEPLYAGMTKTFTPDEFKTTSPSHAKLYSARTPRQLAAVLAELR